MQKSIYATYMRGGTSKGVFFKLSDLPLHCQTAGTPRDQLLLRIIGSPDPYAKQIDGLGNGTSSTSKVALISPCEDGVHDVNYLFGQVAIEQAMIDWSGNCGNLTAAVGVFSLMNGLIDRHKIPQNGICTIKIWQQNIQKTIIAHIPIQNGLVQETGNFQLDGVAFPSSEIKLEFIHPVDSDENMFPTGNLIDQLDVPHLGTFDATLIHAGIPTIFLKATDLGLVGTETQKDINHQPKLLAKLESIRTYGALKMGIISDIQEIQFRQHIPKIAWIAPPMDYMTSGGKQINANQIQLLVRAMSMGQLHHAMMGTVSVAIGVAASIKGTLVSQVANQSSLGEICFGHPSGTLLVGSQSQKINGKWQTQKVVMSRSARRIMSGEVFIPSEYVDSI